MSQKKTLDGFEVEQITTSTREGIELYKHGNTLALSSEGVRGGEVEAIHLTYDELMNLLVDARPHFEDEE